MKKNNKGFSLVELIVVVLILGILAVAVSPQVMKWVDKSKISTDKDNANALKASVQTALAEWQGEGGTIGANNLTVNVKDKTLGTVNNDWGNNNASKTIAAYIAEVTAGSYPDAQYKKYTTPADVSFQITIYGSASGKSGAVEVKCVALDEAAGGAGGATPTTAPASGS